MTDNFDARLIESILRRRTKRFPQGGVLHAKRGRLDYTSKERPTSLTETETALLCFAAAGITGVTVEEIRHLLGHLTVIGRTAASPCASLTLHLFFSDDDGVYYYKSDETEHVVPKKRVRCNVDGYMPLILKDFRENRKKLKEGRIAIPRDAIGSAFESLVNLPGTTLFIPVADTTREYINMLFTGLAQFRWQLWDEVKDQPAGIGSWIGNGFLNGPRMTIAHYDSLLPWLCNLEAGMAMQNLSLVATAMGLGAFMMHTIDLHTVMTCMDVRFEKIAPDAFPQATDNPVGIDGVLEGYVPPYRTIDQAVEEIAEMKWGTHGIYGEEGYRLPKPKIYDRIVDITKAFLTYLYGTYGRIPKYGDALFIPLLVQVHHIDLGYYEKYFPEYLSSEDRNHMITWHD
jgi:hypothetical protein